jgi:VIT1/CCC1 family predicted Fe2+/Mn2+ transporter
MARSEALVPLFPYLIGVPVLGVSLVLMAIALVSGGMVVGRLTGRPVLRSGLRQLVLGALAIAVTFLPRFDIMVSEHDQAGSRLRETER